MSLEKSHVDFKGLRTQYKNWYLEGGVMKKIDHVWEVEALRRLPSEIVNVIRDAVTVLDTEYGENREVDRADGVRY